MRLSVNIQIMSRSIVQLSMNARLPETHAAMIPRVTTTLAAPLRFFPLVKSPYADRAAARKVKIMTR